MYMYTYRGYSSVTIVKQLLVGMIMLNRHVNSPCAGILYGSKQVVQIIDIYQIMKTTRQRQHCPVRWCKKDKQQIQRSKLAENIGYSDTFWGELRKINPACHKSAIGTAQGSSEISTLFFTNINHCIIVCRLVRATQRFT